MTEFISRKYGNEGYEVIIKTTDHEHYRASEEFAMRLIGHAKPMTNGDRLRAMTDEELARTISLHKPMYSWPDSVRKIYYGFKNHNKENPVKAWLEWLQHPVKEDGG